ncbi:MAG: efflux RND transporter periplasmic adaptor subunit [Flammeovirgaceae bacterium]|jgi:membrane fusion protein, heavy metal efflux system|nr:efflux RND transporter periplasmic adaptor subunit [Flammeovirgaceae bacterium]
MKKIGYVIMITLAALMGCGGNSSTDAPDNGLASLSYTLYTDKTELFVEFKPLVMGTTSTFAAHFTKLGENFTALNEGTVTVSLIMGEKGVRHTEESPASPGIYRLALKPSAAGKGRLVFDIKTKDYTDKIVMDDVTVYATAEAAMAEAQPEPSSNTLSYLKEQAWKVEFANAPVYAQPFHEVIKASGEILSAPGDEVIVTANANGAVSFSDNKLTVGAMVSNGQSLFVLSGSTNVTDNTESRYKEAKVNYEKAKADYERATALVKDKIVSEKDYLSAKAAYENAEIAYSTLSKNYSVRGQRINAPIRGYLKNILVSEGQYVTAGQPLATVSQNQKLRLKAEVSQRYYSKLASVKSANFKTVYDGKVYDTQSLNGKLVSYGKNVNHEDHLIPVVFEIDNRGEIIPGSLVEIFMRSNTIANALVIPISALVEEQGTFYVYVQTAGESFEKRELKLGGNDGQYVQILSGVSNGERIVTKGSYQVKLATMSGAVPAHGHEH